MIKLHSKLRSRISESIIMKNYNMLFDKITIKLRKTDSEKHEIKYIHDEFAKRESRAIVNERNTMLKTSFLSKILPFLSKVL